MADERIKMYDLMTNKGRSQKAQDEAVEKAKRKHDYENPWRGLPNKGSLLYKIAQATAKKDEQAD